MLSAKSTCRDSGQSQTQYVENHSPSTDPPFCDSQLELFESRIPKRPYCTDDLHYGLRILPAHVAARKKYIQVNPPWLRSTIVMDIDRPGAGLAWEDALLPMPAWSSMNPENGHAHLAWSLDAPVLLGQHDRQKPMRYLAAVESAMAAKLQADPHYSGLITKNPLNNHWRTYWGRESYDLNYLSEFLDLKKHLPKKAELTGIGRNVDTFDHIRKYAYTEIRLWKGVKREQGIYLHWLNHLYDRAQNFTHNEHPAPLDYTESHHIAKSVGRWVWNRFSIEGFTAWQLRKSKAGGRARSKAYAGRRATATLMRDEGITQQQIADALDVSRMTIHRWLKGSVTMPISDRSNPEG